MADEPPPIDVEGTEEEPVEQKDTPKTEEPTQEVSLEDPEPKKDDSDDLFGEDSPSTTSDDQTRLHASSDPPTLETTDPEPVAVEVKPSSKTEPATVDDDDDLFGMQNDDEPEPKPKEQPSQPTEEKPQQEEEEEEEDEEDDVVDPSEIVITVTEPEKVGDGMGAYVTYLVTTKSTLTIFKDKEFYVRRRFSDFLGLYFQLTEKYAQLGRIVPPAPEKSVSGMTKVKFSKNEDSGTVFIEKRRANLERFLNRVVRHPAIRKDEILKNFLETAGELPKAKQTAAMSGAGFMRLVKNVGDSISKVAGKKSETDAWFEDRQVEYEVLEHHLKKLHSAIENMIVARKDLCLSTGAFVKSVSTLANVEENNSLSRALTRLSEVEEKVESLHHDQSNKDLYVFGETIRDYIQLMASIKETFNQRVKVYNTLLNAQKTLQSKREQEAKLQATGKVEKLPLVQDEIHDWEKKEKNSQKAFDKCSRVLKQEVERFEKERTVEFKDKFIEHLEGLMTMQEELIRVWEEYLPDAQAIDAEA